MREYSAGSIGSILNGVAASAANDIWAAGYYFQPGGAPEQTLIEHWNGSAWSIVSSPNTTATVENDLFQVTALSSTDVWAVGEYQSATSGGSFILHWDGSRWNLATGPQAPLLNSNGALYGVRALAANNVWAVGATYALVNGVPESFTFVIHWNGSNWSIVSSPGSTDQNIFFGVTAVPGTQTLWAVGLSGSTNFNTLTAHYC